MLRLNRKSVNRISFLAIIVSGILLILMQITYKGSAYPGFAKITKGWKIDDDSRMLSLEETAKTDKADYSMTHALPEDTTEYDVVVFKSENIFWEFYINGKLQETFEKDRVFPGMTAGDHWHILMIPKEAQGGTMTISIHKPYSIGPQPIREIYYANHKYAAESLLRSFIIALMLTIFTLAVALMAILANLLLVDPKRRDYTLCWLGLFVTFMSIWSVTQSPVVGILYGVHFAVIMTLYLSMPLALGFATIYFMNIAKFPKTWWNIALCAIPFLVAIVNPILELTHKVPFAVTMVVMGVYYLQFTSMVIAASLRLAHRQYLGRDSSRLIAGASIYMVAIAWLDIYQTAVMHGNDYTGNVRVSMLVYLIIVSVDRLLVFADYRQKMEEAKAMSRMAYVDGLTNISNRMAFNKKMNELELSDRTGFVSFDVNNLKTANDVYGHIEGDNLICLAADAITRAFGENGTAYRYGGDEFVVIMEDFSDKAADESLAKLKKIIEKTNEAKVLHVDFSIAGGYAVYDKAKDESLMSTLNRADDVMYENKKLMKGAANVR